LNRSKKQDENKNESAEKKLQNLNIAPMGTASFFGIAQKLSKVLLPAIRNDKKDIVDSGLETR